jgi:hypothetical protein
MKKTLFNFSPYIIILGMAACSSPQEKQATDSTTIKTEVTQTTIDTVVASEFCFLGTGGSKNQDSTKVHLLIKDSTVTGDMNWMPYEKDRRLGKLQGVKKGDEITAVWTFMQEGMEDTLTTQFKLSNDKLVQKALKLNTKTGRQQTDRNDNYTLAYKAVDCSALGLK